MTVSGDTPTSARRLKMHGIRQMRIIRRERRAIAWYGATQVDISLLFALYLAGINDEFLGA